MLQPAAVRDIFTKVAEFFGTTRGTVVQRVINVVVIWIVAWLAYQLVKSVGRVLILLVAALVTVGQFLAITPLLAAGGILGLAVSFGAQSLVKDIIAGFFILSENQFGIGDVIEAAGKSGTVERMTLRITMLRDLRGVLHVVPNGHITTVSNLTRSWFRAVVEVGVGYGTDLDQALAVFRDTLTRFQAEPGWKNRLEGSSEVLGVEQLGDHGVAIRTIIRTAPGAQWEVEREFRRRLKNRLDAEAVEIPFPQRTVQVRHHSSSAQETPAFPAEGS